MIRNLKITQKNSGYVGLFGYAENAVIKNIGLENISINSNDANTGGICGESSSLIYNCYSTGDIETSNGYVGGICGSNNKSIEYCYNLCTIYGYDKVIPLTGGICGDNAGSISYCFNGGKVETASPSYAAAGGICGSTMEESSVRNCYNTMSVSASGDTFVYAGGICGWIQGTYTPHSYNVPSGNYVNIISDSYNTGSVTSNSNDYTYAGGVLGANETFAVIGKCYNAGDIYASSDVKENIFIGGVAGHNNTFVSNSYWDREKIYKANDTELSDEEKKGVGSGTDTSTPLYTPQMKITKPFKGFDFENTWGIEREINEGYPYLKNIRTEYLPPEEVSTWENGIEIIPPKKTTYIEGQTLDLTGIEVYVTEGINYSDGTSRITYIKKLETVDVDLENKPLALEDKYVTVLGGYTPEGVYLSVSGTFEIKVSPGAVEESNFVLEPQYGRNKKFLAPIEAPVADSIPISSREELEAIKNDLNGTYHLTADIDLSEADWTPIGDNSTDSLESWFTGVFDGQGHVIQNLKITQKNNGYVGLFGYAENATIKNVGLENIQISSTDPSTGGICGINKSLIYNCYTTGLIKAINGDAGGICGNNHKSIEYCYNLCTMDGFDEVIALTGGICGSNSASIRYCFNGGKVETVSPSYANAGGICGWIQGPMAPDSYNVSSGNDSNTISDCYNIGSVNCITAQSAYAGGIFGGNESFAMVGKCYNAGDIYASSEMIENIFIGGIGGLNNTFVSNCYWDREKVYKMNDVELSGEEKKGVGSGTDTSTPLYTQQMKNTELFEAFDFENTWGSVRDINEGYPYLKNIRMEDLPPDEVYVWDGGVEIVLPNKTVYTEGEILDLTGLEVYGTSGIKYSDGTSKITHREKFEHVIVELENKPLTVEDRYVTVSGWYSILQMSISGQFEITVNPRTISGNSLQLVGSDGSVITELTGGIEVHAEAVYSTIENEKTTVYMALYDKDGVLKNIKLAAQTAEENETATLVTNAISLPENIDGAYIKLFLWNDALKAAHDAVKIN